MPAAEAAGDRSNIGLSPSISVHLRLSARIGSFAALLNMDGPAAARNAKDIPEEYSWPAPPKIIPAVPAHTIAIDDDDDHHRRRSQENQSMATDDSSVVTLDDEPGEKKYRYTADGSSDHRMAIVDDHTISLWEEQDYDKSVMLSPTVLIVSDIESNPKLISSVSMNNLNVRSKPFDFDDSNDSNLRRSYSMNDHINGNHEGNISNNSIEMGTDDQQYMDDKDSHTNGGYNQSSSAVLATTPPSARRVRGPETFEQFTRRIEQRMSYHFNMSSYVDDDDDEYSAPGQTFLSGVLEETESFARREFGPSGPPNYMDLTNPSTKHHGSSSVAAKPRPGIVGGAPHSLAQHQSVMLFVLDMLLWPFRKIRNGYIGCMMSIEEGARHW